MLATIINYMDRLALNQMAVRIKTYFGMSNYEYSMLESAFSFAFAVGAITTGFIVDKVSVRWVYPLMVLGWSAAGVLTGFANGFWMLLTCRFALGLFESGNWPCGIRTTRAVLRHEERSLGNSIFQSGTALGAATYPSDAESAADLIERTREALAEARSLGRNRVWCYARRARVPVKTPVYFDGTEPSIVGFSSDLSPSGIFIKTPAPLEAGMRCALAFPLPGTEENVHVIGRVVRSVTHADPDSHASPEPSTGMGIEFEKFGPEDRLTIETFLHNVMSRNPGRTNTAD
jgi:uncharacterized protein (TIGR02266 family)